MNIGRLKLAAGVSGAAKTTTSHAIVYAKEREQFKQPIANFGAIQHKLAEQAIRIYACESALYRTSNNILLTKTSLEKEGKKYEEAVLSAAQEYAVECALLKVHGSEVLDYVVDEGVQVLGGYGYSADYPMDRAYRDSRINRIFEGTNEINRMLSVGMLLKRAMKGEIDLMGPAQAIQKELMSIPDFGDKEEGLLVDQKEAIAKMKKAVLMVAGSAAMKFKEEMEKEQEIIMNIADMLIETYVSESTLLRTLKLAGLKGEDQAKYQIEMAKVYINDAMDRINVAGKNAIGSFGEGDELRMLLMGLKRFTKVIPVNTKELRRSVAKKLIEEGKYCF